MLNTVLNTKVECNDLSNFIKVTLLYQSAPLPEQEVSPRLGSFFPFRKLCY